MYLALDCALREMLPHARLLVPSATFSRCGRTTTDDHCTTHDSCQSRPVRVRPAVFRGRALACRMEILAALRGATARAAWAIRVPLACVCWHVCVCVCVCQSGALLRR